MNHEATRMPSLAVSLVAMTALQALVALGLFAPGVIAPAAGLMAPDVALFSSACFAVGMASALLAGRLTGRLGSFGTASLCMMAVAAAMVVSGLGGTFSLLMGGLLMGIAFGPETPASSGLLGRVASERHRPLVFSLRQTGNQLGAILASLLLPFLALKGGHWPFVFVAGAALVAAVVYGLLERKYSTAFEGPPVKIRASLALLRRDAAIRSLALASAPLSAMQLALNAFLVTHLVVNLRLEHALAGVVLGVAQAGGLVGRLGWGFVSGRFCSARALLAALAVGMAVSATIVALLPEKTPLPILFPVAFLFGLTASGWNGVFLAEIARIAPEGRIAEVTGAVLMASYGGLFAAPLLISLLAGLGGLPLAYCALALLAVAAAFSTAH